LRRIALIFALGAAAAVVGGRFGYEWWTGGRFLESTDDAYVGGDVTPISPHIGGFVARILVGDNQLVRAGQILIRLDDRDMRAAAAHAQAVLQQRQAALAALRAKYILAQDAVAQAQADLSAKAAQASFAAQDDARYRKLALVNFGSRQNAEKAFASDQQARSAVVGAQAGLASAREQLNELDAETDEAIGAVKQAEADLRTAQLDLSYAEIRSPVAGYVGNRSAEVGAYVAPGAYLLSVIPARGLWVDANFKEDQLANMEAGQSATVTADAAPGRVFHGHVISLAPATGATFSVVPPENATGNFTKIVQRVPVRIALDAGDARLGAIRPGLSMTAWVDTRSSGAAP
jgi:membrane fusion protein (multidrug efflux system)